MSCQYFEQVLEKKIHETVITFPVSFSGVGINANGVSEYRGVSRSDMLAFDGAEPARKS